MRNGAMRIPSMMMSFGNGTRLQKSIPFEIQKSNLFMGPKRPVMEIKNLTLDQKQQLELTIAGYQLTASRQIQTALLLTAVLATALLIWVF